MPDLSWLEDVLPNNDQVESVQKSLKSILDAVKKIDFGKLIKLTWFLVEELKCVKGNPMSITYSIEYTKNSLNITHQINGYNIF